MGEPQVLTDDQIAVRDLIISTGLSWGFTENQIDVAVRVAFKESAFGRITENPGSTASGIFQYTDGTWSDFYSDLDRSVSADSIKAFYTDLANYQGKYLEAIASGQLPESVTFGEYVYVMHHDGRYTSLANVVNSAAIAIYDGIADYYYEGMQQASDAAGGGGALGAESDPSATGSMEGELEFWAMLGDVPIYDLRFGRPGGGGVGDSEYIPPDGAPPITIPGDVPSTSYDYFF
jgi:hypothetical protein